jgi:hypothetical protein
MAYRTNDGVVLHSLDAADVVAELRKISNTPTESDSAFMLESSNRIWLKLERRVRHREPAAFVHDLLAIGLLFDDDNAD